MANNQAKIILATGGTGGHIFPALAVKDYLLEQGFQVILTSDNKYQNFLVPDEYTFIISSSSFADKSLSGILKAGFKNFWGLIYALFIILKFKPNLIYGFGGYASFPMLLAARILHKKIAIHEANTAMGKVNKIFISYSCFITSGFHDLKNIPTEALTKVYFSGNPLRNKITARLDDNPKETLNILVIGGSQGAKIFSKLITDAIINLPNNIKDKLKIFQQAKPEDIEKIEKQYSKKNINFEIKSFFTDIDNYYQNSDLVIARAGASTISELIAVGLPAILIPLPSAADNHQYYNALSLAQNKGAILFEENLAKTRDLSAIIAKLFLQRELLVNMKSNLIRLRSQPLPRIKTLINSQIN